MRVAGLVLTLGLLLTVASGPAWAQKHSRKGHRSSHHGHSPTQLRKDLNDLRSQKQKLQKQLSETKNQTHAVLTDIYSVDAKLDKLQDELDNTTTRLSDSRAEQARLTVELTSASAKLDATRDQVRDRLRHIYVHGNASFISALVGTRSVGEVASRRFLLQMIAKKDRQLFSDYQKLRNLVAERKRKQDRLVVHIRELQSEEADQQAELKDTRAQKKQVLNGLRDKQGKLRQLISQFESDERDLASEIAAYARRKRRPGEKELPAFHGRLMRPVDGPITSGFGMRYHPILHITRLHAGVDFGVPSGTPVHSAADGEVITARYSTSFGNFVVIDHGGGITTVYAHCSSLLVRDGQSVHRGQTIAISGATGLAAGPHVHFEVHVGGHVVNPRSWL